MRILTGMEEAIDGWITTNILLEKFKHRHTEAKRVERLASGDELDEDMVGVLDLGGASTQVTFTCKVSRRSARRSAPFSYPFFPLKIRASPATNRFRPISPRTSRCSTRSTIRTLTVISVGAKTKRCGGIELDW